MWEEDGGKMKIRYEGYKAPKDKPGWAWHVADDYISESHRLFWHREDAEKYYATLKENHPKWLHQLEIK